MKEKGFRIHRSSGQFAWHREWCEGLVIKQLRLASVGTGDLKFTWSWIIIMTLVCFLNRKKSWICKQSRSRWGGSKWAQNELHYLNLQKNRIDSKQVPIYCWVDREIFQSSDSYSRPSRDFLLYNRDAKTTRPRRPKDKHKQGQIRGRKCARRKSVLHRRSKTVRCSI